MLSPDKVAAIFDEVVPGPARGSQDDWQPPTEYPDSADVERDIEPAAADFATAKSRALKLTDFDDCGGTSSSDQS